MNRTACVLKPCAECPFTRQPRAVRLTYSRTRELAANMLSTDGTRFTCHKTNGFDDDGDACETDASLHCAGALIFAEKQHRATQWMRWMERLGVYDHRQLQGQDVVFDSVAEMLKTALTSKRERQP